MAGADGHMPPLSRLGRAALTYAQKGYRVFPLEPQGKTPRTAHGCKDATTDTTQVEGWWRAMPDANIGMATGQGILVIDVDGPEGEASLDQLVDLYGPLPRTPTQTTGKGRHFLFSVDPSVEVRNTAGKLGNRIDTRGDGGYVVVAPSVHPTGALYQWDPETKPSLVPAAPAPEWLLAAIRPQKISEIASVEQMDPGSFDSHEKYIAAALTNEFELVSRAGSGTRNHSLNKAAFSLGTLVGAGAVGEAEVRRLLETAASNCGLTREDGPHAVARTIQSGLAAGMAQPRALPERRKPAPGSPKPAPGSRQLKVVGGSEAPDPRDERVYTPRESVWVGGNVPEDFILTTEGLPAKRSLHNVHLHLVHEVALAGLFAEDSRTRAIWVTRETPWAGGPTPRELSDTDVTGLAMLLEQRRLSPSLENCGRAIAYVAAQNRIDPVRQRLEALEWDRVARLDHWAVDHLGASDTSFVRQASAKWLIGAVARIIRPGCKMDTMLVLEGPQGARKSSALAALASAIDGGFTDRLSKLDSKDAAIELQGNIIVEMAELDAFRHAAVSTIKAFLSRQADKIRLPFAKTMTELQRSCVFAGTVNPGGAGWLHDETGGRRFWPIAVGEIDIKALTAAAPQLWAEALSRYRDGEEWWITDAVVLAEAQAAQAERIEEDVWAPLIDAYVAHLSQVQVIDVLREACDVPKERMGQREKNRITAHLQRRGWRRHHGWIAGKTAKVYLAPSRAP